MKAAAIFSTFFLFANVVVAQNTVFAPPGATWFQTPYSWKCEPAEQLFTWTADQDTLLDGWAARVIHCNEFKSGVFQQKNELTRIIAVIEHNVFWWVGGQFVPLFDFGAMPGDTISSAAEGPHVESGCDGGAGIFKYRIDSISTTIIDGVNLRVQFVSAVHLPGSIDQTWTMGWLSPMIVERLGAVRATDWYGMSSACVLAGCMSFIRCYADDELHFQAENWNFPDCNFTTKTAEPTSNFLKISPNPASDFIELPFLPDEIHLVNSFGQSVEISPSGNLLDISRLNPGIWFLRLKNRNDWFRFRVIVQRSR